MFNRDQLHDAAFYQFEEDELWRLVCGVTKVLRKKLTFRQFQPREVTLIEITYEADNGRAEKLFKVQLVCDHVDRINCPCEVKVFCSFSYTPIEFNIVLPA